MVSRRTVEGSGSGSGIDNQCQYTDAFQNPVIMASLTVSGICLFTYLIMAYLWHVWRKTNDSVRSILPLLAFGTALVFAIVCYILSIVYIPLAFCLNIDGSIDAGLVISPMWLGNISDLIVFGIILVPLTRAIASASGATATRAKPWNIMIAWFVALLVLVMLIFATLMSISSSYPSYSRSRLNGWIWEGWTAATEVLYLIAAIGGGISLLLKVNHISSGHRFTAGMKQSTVLTVGALITARLLVAVNWLGWSDIGGLSHSVPQAIVFSTLESFGLVLTAFGTLWTAKCLDFHTTAGVSGGMTCAGAGSMDNTVRYGPIF